MCGYCARPKHHLSYAFQEEGGHPPQCQRMFRNHMIMKALITGRRILCFRFTINPFEVVCYLTKYVIYIINSHSEFMF